VRFATEHNQEIETIFTQGEIITNNSNLIILRKFVKDFENSMTTLFGATSDYMVTFEDTCNIFHSIGFIKTAYELVKTTITENNMENQTTELVENKDEENNSNHANKNKKESKESKDSSNNNEILRNAWKLLTAGKTDVEKLDSNQLLVFCTAVLGIYTGENIDLGGSKSFVLNTEGTIGNTKENEADQKKDSGDPKSDKKRPQKYEESKSSLHISPTNVNVSKTKKDKTLIKMVLPNFDMNKYSYHSKTAKLINSLFNQFCLNRTDFILEAKIKAKSETEMNLSKLAAAQNTKSQKDIDRVNKASEQWRKKCFEV